MVNFMLSILYHRRRQWHPTPVLLLGKSHGRRSLVGCSPWGRYKSDTTERLHFHFSLSCIGGENGNPLQNSCPENPRDGGAWWAALYGVAQSQTRLKRLNSSIRSDQISGSVLSDSLQPHESQHVRPPCPSLTPRVHSDSRPLSHLILCHPLLLLPPIPPSIRVFPNESSLCIRWPKYWSFSFSIIPSKEIQG